MKQHNSSASILCPGHTRTVVGLDCSANTPDGVFFVSACLGNHSLMRVIQDGKPMLREAKTGNWIGSFIGHEVLFFLLLDDLGRGLVCSREQGRYAGGYS